jgi:hypothetical protein
MIPKGPGGTQRGDAGLGFKWYFLGIDAFSWLTKNQKGENLMIS